MAAWVWLAALLCGTQAVVLPPPWADVRRNPCAAHPRGWLMLYWPSDGKCYTIYKKGYPCPESQELSPGRWGGRTIAECKCPPGTAQLPHTTTCHKLFERGPCRPGEYFAPVEETFNKRGERQGMCVRPQKCADETLLYWPADGKCYYRLSQGPCYSGSILDVGEDGLANCTCTPGGTHYWPIDGGCYALYTRGPCERGQLFLPGSKCGCDQNLPHYHNGTEACYELGYPCPESQELSPGRWGGRTIAECKCPPGTAQLPHTTTCHKLFERGPCRPGEYFAPVEETFNKRGERQGMCVRPQKCADETLLYWPADGKCYYRLSQGPCYSGSILDVGEDGLANCTCTPGGTHYWPIDGGCYALYTRGPCERGQLFLPGSKCGCDQNLPHYHNGTEACYELDSVGPCPKGHLFSISEVSHQGSRAECQCKSFHARAADGACYRLYTRGPCANDEMIARGGRCTKVPCARGRLYMPERRRCYRPGTADPCPAGEVVAFDFEARPALDGLSHNGVCACGSGVCSRQEVATCSSKRGTGVFNSTCHILHTQGPCPEGTWLAKDHNGTVRCQCIPGRESNSCLDDKSVKS